jgi:hypothetical protein
VAVEPSTESADKDSVQMYNIKSADSTVFQTISSWNLKSSLLGKYFSLYRCSDHTWSFSHFLRSAIQYFAVCLIFKLGRGIVLLEYPTKNGYARSMVTDVI